MMTLAIKCKGAELANLDDLLDFQGDLKTLSEENYHKLKNDLLCLGVSEPVSVWVYNGKKYLLNGHQRVKTLKRMRDEGYEIPPIPISLVEADDIKQAKRKVLALTSQFGEMSQAGLLDFCEKNDFVIDDMLKEFRFPEIFIIKDVDYSLLDGENKDDEINEMSSQVKKSIQIEFKESDYEEALELINEHRKKGLYLGGEIIEFLKAKK